MAIAEQQHHPWPAIWRLLVQPVGKHHSLACCVGTTAQHLQRTAGCVTLAGIGLPRSWAGDQQDRCSAAGLPIQGRIQAVIAIQHHQPGSTGCRPEPGTHPGPDEPEQRRGEQHTEAQPDANHRIQLKPIPPARPATSTRTRAGGCGRHRSGGRARGARWAGAGGSPGAAAAGDRARLRPRGPRSQAPIGMAKPALGRSIREGGT